METLESSDPRSLMCPRQDSNRKSTDTFYCNLLPECKPGKEEEQRRNCSYRRERTRNGGRQLAQGPEGCRLESASPQPCV